MYASTMSENVVCSLDKPVRLSIFARGKVLDVSFHKGEETFRERAFSSLISRLRYIWRISRATSCRSLHSAIALARRCVYDELTDPLVFDVAFRAGETSIDAFGAMSCWRPNP
jgi:hypothetical protein